jgi:serine protease
MRRTIALLAAAMCGLVPVVVTAGQVSAAPVIAADGLREGQLYRSFIVTPKPGAAASVAGARTLATGGRTVRAGRPLDAAGARAFMAGLAATPGVAAVEPDLPVTRTSTPDDPRYGE